MNKDWQIRCEICKEIKVKRWVGQTICTDCGKQICMEEFIGRR